MDILVSDNTVSFIIPRSSGGTYVIGLGQTLSSLDWDSANTKVLCEVDQGKETRFNDAKCDVSGRLWAGIQLRLLLYAVLMVIFLALFLRVLVQTAQVDCRSFPPVLYSHAPLLCIIASRVHFSEWKLANLRLREIPPPQGA